MNNLKPFHYGGIVKRSIFFLSLIFCLWAVSPLAAQDDTVAGESNDHTVMVGDESREYIVHTPANYDPTTPVPLVIMLHGGAGGSAEFNAFSGMNAVADSAGFLAVYPNSSNGIWNFLSRDGRADDLAFMDALLEQVQSDYAVDSAQIYAVGYSNGGLMALRMRCSMGDQLAGVGVMNATMTYALAEFCLDAPPLPTILVLGMSDPAFPWEGYAAAGEDDSLISTFSSSQTVGFFSTLNHCVTQPPSIEEITADGSDTRVLQQRFELCDRSAYFHMLGLVDFGNYYPSRPLIQIGDQSLTVQGAIWAFLSRHSRAQGN